MANYSTARWEAFQYKASEMMQKPEFKFKPSPVLMKFLQNTDFLIPASEKERVLGVKQSDQDTVYLNTLYKQSHSTASARAYNHTGSVNDSERATLTFTTYAADFTYSLKSADRTIWNEAEIVAAQLRSAAIALHSSIETALLANLNTNKSQVVISSTPASGTWDATNYLFGIANADEARFIQRMKGFMREQYYRGQIDAILNEYLHQEAMYLANQGAGNAANTQFQFAGVNFGQDASQELTNDATYDGMGYMFPVGSIGLLPWIPEKNRSGFGDPGKAGGFYTSIPDPLGSGLQFAVHEYWGGADNDGAAGETQDINVNVELSIDLAPHVATMQTANQLPVFKFGLLSENI